MLICQPVGTKYTASLKGDFRVLSQSGWAHVGVCRILKSDSRVNKTHTRREEESLYCYLLLTVLEISELSQFMSVWNCTFIQAGRNLGRVYLMNSTYGDIYLKRWHSLVKGSIFLQKKLILYIECLTQNICVSGKVPANDIHLTLWYCIVF